MAAPRILIAGAGPTGLTAAMELRRRGYAARIVDPASGPTPDSKAVGVNARSLELLEASGVTERLLARGVRQIRGDVHDGGRRFLRIDLSRIDHPRYNFILALPQNETEALLLGRLEELGGEVEWHTRLAGLDPAARVARLDGPSGAEEAACDILLGADGAHSVVRKSLGLGFEGERYPEDWRLADVHLGWDRDVHGAQIFTGPKGAFLFCIAIAAGDGGPSRWRLIGNQPDIYSMLPEGTHVGEAVWTSDFHISRRIVERFGDGDVYLAGDAAHIHPPAGGRGMNLGIEDAWSFARAVARGELAGYREARKAMARHVVAQTDAFFRVATARSPVVRALRNLAGRTVLRLPFLQRRLMTNLSGIEADRVRPD